MVSQFRFNFRQFEDVKGTFSGSCTQHKGTGFLAGCWQGLVVSIGSFLKYNAQSGAHSSCKNSISKEMDAYGFAEGAEGAEGFGRGSLG